MEAWGRSGSARNAATLPNITYKWEVSLTVKWVHPASCVHKAQEEGCRTRWQWSWPENNWLSTRRPIIPCSHYVISVVRYINVFLKSTQQNSCLHPLFINAAVKRDRDWGWTAFSCRKIYWKVFGLWVKLCWSFFLVMAVNTGIHCQSWYNCYQFSQFENMERNKAIVCVLSFWPFKSLLLFEHSGSDTCRRLFTVDIL